MSRLSQKTSLELVHRNEISKHAIYPNTISQRKNKTKQINPNTKWTPIKDFIAEHLR